MTLEPYAALVRWRAPRPQAAATWRALVAEFAELATRRAAGAGAPVIGHVKGFASTSGDGFLHVSVVSPDRPASVEGHLPEGLQELNLTLNVLVYGLPLETVGALVREVAVDQGLRSRCDVAVEPARSENRIRAVPAD